jgi:hypothetical protein
MNFNRRHQARDAKKPQPREVAVGGVWPDSPYSPYAATDPWATAPLSHVDGVAYAPQSPAWTEPAWTEVAAVQPKLPAWFGRTRRWIRAGVWALPVAAIALAIAGIWGTEGSNGASPGSWLVLTAAGLALAVLGAVCLTALLVTTPGRRWGLAGLVGVVTGTVVFAPTLGVIGLARPAASHLGVIAAFDAELAAGSAWRWLGMSGMLLLALGWTLLALGIVASRRFSRADGFLILAAIALALLGSALEIFVVLAALSLLAAGLGLAWSAIRWTDPH